MRLSMQQRIIKELHIQSSVDPKNEIQKRIQFLKDYLLKTKSHWLPALHLDWVLRQPGLLRKQVPPWC